ncbi:MAG TPA: glycosyltransferase [Chroococcales cyanobacterium]|jgi:glycosyltransferase involved in cell wall biosynthesis
MLSVCLIVRNEAENLGCCLESVRGIADEIVLVDTGSTDDTVAIAAEYHAKVFSFSWKDDFAAARNEALCHASGDWILVLDADESLAEGSKDELRLLLEAPQAEAYSLELVNLTGKGEGRQIARFVRLFRNRPTFRYEGRIHEQILPSLERAGISPFPAAVRIVHRGYLNEALAARDKYRRNLELLLKELEGDPENPFLHFNTGQTYKLMNKKEEAEKHYALSLRGLPKKALPPYLGYLYFSFVDLLREQKKFPAAIALAEEGRKRFPRYPDLDFAYGQALLEANLPAEALEIFENCLQLEGFLHEGGSDPGVTSYKAWNAIGVCHERAGRFEEALEALQKAIDCSPQGDVEGLLNRGILLSKIGRGGEADQDLGEVLKIDDTRFEAWQNLGSNALQRGDLPRARVAFERAHLLFPSPDLRFLLEKIR